jgi:hypothetical protein
LLDDPAGDQCVGRRAIAAGGSGTTAKAAESRKKAPCLLAGRKLAGFLQSTAANG